MGGADIQGNVEFTFNPKVVFPSTGGVSNFPNLLQSDISQWFVDISNGPYPGFNEASLNTIDKFVGGWEIIGQDAFNFTNLKLKVDNSQNLTDIFEQPEYLTDICSGAFKGLDLDGRIDFSSSYEVLTNIGEEAFKNNSFSGIRLADLSNLTTLGNNVFQTGLNISGGEITLSNLPELTSIPEFAFADNVSNSKLTLELLPKVQTIEQYAFYNSSISGDVTISGLELLSSISSYAFGTSHLSQAAQIRSVEFVDLPKLESVGVLKDNFSFGNDNLVLKNLPSYTDDASLIDLRNNLGQNNDSSFTGDLTLEGLPGLTSIQDFSGFARNFTGKLTIKDCSNLTQLYVGAFQDCKFTDLEIENNNNLKFIFENVFQNNDLSGSLTLNSKNLFLINSNAFRNNPNLSGKLTISSEFAQLFIGNEAFLDTCFSQVSLTRSNPGLLQVYENVFPQLNGVQDTTNTITWDNSGFTISYETELIWNVPP
jgi:hypothetical protein